jgi:hypothetical protein
MPSYTYLCERCNQKIEMFFTFKDYKDTIICNKCSSLCNRCYHDDLLSISGSVKKADSELKTIGDLANRNRDKMSEDHKQSLLQKHNSYKDEKPQKVLPKGMSRLPKGGGRTKWT